MDGVYNVVKNPIPKTLKHPFIYFSLIETTL